MRRAAGRGVKPKAAAAGLDVLQALGSVRNIRDSLLLQIMLKRMLPVLQVACEIAGLALALAALPLFAELLVLSVAALLPGRVALGAEPGEFRLAVVVPAHNEEMLIGQCVRSLADSSGPAVTIYVVAHNCSDGTAESAMAAGARVLALHDTVGGKGVALDHGFGHALGEGADGVLVVDADSVVSANLTAVVAARLGAGAAALQCRYQVANAAGNPRTRLAALAFLGMNVLRPRGRERLGLSCGIFGNGFALAAATLRLVPYTANSLVEDLEYHLHLIDRGLRVEFVDQATVFGEMPETGSAAASQRARWEGGRILMRRQWAPVLLRKVLRGQGRMIEPLFDLLALPLATEAALLGAVLALGWFARSVWLLGYGAVGVCGVLLYLVAAAGLGPEPGRTLAALGAAPGYVVWKLMMIPRTRLAARGGAAWVRTRRNVEGDEEK